MVLQFVSTFTPPRRLEVWVKLQSVVYDEEGNERKFVPAKDFAELSISCTYLPLSASMPGSTSYLMRRFPPKMPQPPQPLFFLRVAVDRLDLVHNRAGCQVRVSCTPAIAPGTGKLLHDRKTVAVTKFESGFLAVSDGAAEGKTAEDVEELHNDIKLLKSHGVPDYLIADIVDESIQVIDGKRFGRVDFLQSFCFLLHDPREATVLIEVIGAPEGSGEGECQREKELRHALSGAGEDRVGTITLDPSELMRAKSNRRGFRTKLGI